MSVSSRWRSQIGTVYTNGCAHKLQEISHKYKMYVWGFLLKTTTVCTQLYTRNAHTFFSTWVDKLSWLRIWSCHKPHFKNKALNNQESGIWEQYIIIRFHDPGWNVLMFSCMRHFVIRFGALSHKSTSIFRYRCVAMFPVLRIHHWITHVSVIHIHVTHVLFVMYILI